MKPQANPSQFNEAAYWRGEYSPLATYDKGEAVSHGGSAWLCLQYDVHGVTPGTDAQKWALLASRGDTGLAQAAFVVFGKSGVLTTSVGQHRVKTRYDVLLEAIDLSVTTAPAGADIIVDVNVDGSSIFPNQASRPRIVAGQTTGTTSTNVAIPAGSFITVDIDQVGSTSPGTGLTVQLWATRTS